MGTLQDKLGRGVVYAGCVGFRSLWRATALRGKNRAWEVAPMFRPEKAKSWPPIVVWSCGHRHCGAYLFLACNYSTVIIMLRSTFQFEHSLWAWSKLIKMMKSGMSGCLPMQMTNPQ